METSCNYRIKVDKLSADNQSQASTAPSSGPSLLPSVTPSACHRALQQPPHRLRRHLCGVPAERSLRQLGAHLDRRRRPAEHRSRREVESRRHRCFHRSVRRHQPRASALVGKMVLAYAPMLCVSFAVPFDHEHKSLASQRSVKARNIL